MNLFGSGLEVSSDVTSFIHMQEERGDLVRVYGLVKPKSVGTNIGAKVFNLEKALSEMDSVNKFLDIDIIQVTRVLKLVGDNLIDYGFE